ncbi:MAG: DUF1854 domain-containing protein [Spirochaetota bacterium]
MANQEMNLIAVDDIRLRHNESGDTIAMIRGTEHVIGQIQSVFPISNRHHFALLRDEHGGEIGIIEQAHELDAESKRVLRDELERSYFLPRITDIRDVDEKHGVFTMDVITDRGERSFEVRNPRQNIRPVGGGRYIIKDVDGNRYDIPRLRNLGPKSQNLMTEFV